jgi:hypothetical protein
LEEEKMIRLTLILALIVVTLFSSAYAVDESLILYLPLDEGAGGEAEDSSSYGNNGEIVGNVKWVEGKIGDALELSPGAYVELPEIPQYDVTSAVSLMAWVNTSSVTTWARIIDKSQWQDNGFDLALSQVTHAPLFEFFVNDTTSQALAITPVDDGKWHFVAGTFGNKKLRIYVDSVMEREVTSAGSVDIKPNDWPIRLGVEANQSKGQQYSGVLDEVAIFNRELSADDIKDIFLNGIDISTSVDPKQKLATTWGALRSYN